MKFESPYDNGELASKATFDCNKQLPSHILKLDDRGRKIEQDVMFDAKEGQVNQSCNVSNADYLSSETVSIKNRENERDSSTTRCPHAASEISLISQEGLLFYTDKTVTEVELPPLSISAKASSTVKDICIDEGAEKILVEYDETDQSIFSNSNFSRVNGSGALEEARENENSQDLKPLSANEGLGSSNSVSERKPFDERSHLEEFNTDFPQLESSSHGDGISESEDLRRKLEQVLEEEEISTTMVASSAEKSKESKLVPGAISGNNYPFEKEKTSEFVVSSNDTESNIIDDTKIDVAARNTSIVGSENKIVNTQQIVHYQNGIEPKEPVFEGTTSARSSFSHLNHGDSNLLGPANFSGSIISSSHMPYSGNISLRSESSTTSGQSFAFPILQPEWSSSPVRMAKADRRHLRKQRWKTALTCCKF